MAATQELPIFTWKGKTYSVIVNSDIYNNWQKYFEDEDALIEALMEGLPLQANEDGSRKYPELATRPNTYSEEFRKLDREWWNSRLQKGGASMGELPPSKTAVKEWAENNPGAEEFFDAMVAYGQGQGLTYGFGDEMGLPGSVEAYNYFSNQYPNISMGAEVVGSIPTSLGVSGAIRTVAPRIASKIPFISGKPLPQTAGFIERLGRIARNMGLTGLEGMLHMYAWRAGHYIGPNATDPNVIQRLKEAAVGRGALLDYGIAGGASAFLPVVGRAVTGIKNIVRNIAQRRGGELGADALANTRAAESFVESVPIYAEMGIPEDVIWGELHKAVVTEGKAMADAVALTRRSLDRLISTGEPGALQALPISRDLAWAAETVPEAATLRLGERVAEGAGVTRRMQEMLRATRGGLLSDPRASLSSIVDDYSQRAKEFYQVLSRESTDLDREVFRKLIKPKGSWKARTKETGLTYTDMGWDDTIDELDTILRTESGQEAYRKAYGVLPSKLPTRKEFLDNKHYIDSRESKALIDSGEYRRMAETDGTILPRVKYVDDAGNTRYWHILRKNNNTIKPLHAQMIEQNMYKRLNYTDPANTTSPAPTKRVQDVVRAEIKDWNDAIGEAIPAYKNANKVHNEKRLIEEAYEAGKAPGIFDESGKGYDAFNDWLDKWKKTAGTLDSDSIAYNDAMRVFFSRSLKDFLPPNAKPEDILRSPELQGRLYRYIGNEDAYKNFMLSLLDEQAKLDVTRSFPAAQHQLAAKGRTSTEALQSGPTLLEAAPSTAAMFAFSPAFAAGRRGASLMQFLRGQKNEEVAASLVRRLLSTDRSVKDRFLVDLQERVAKLRSPIESGMEASYGAGPVAAQAWEGGEQYLTPPRERRKEIPSFLDYRGLIQ